MSVISYHMSHLRLSSVLQSALSATLVLIGGFLFFTLNPTPALAALGDGASSTIHLLDGNENGTPDTITFNIANPNGESWATIGSAPYGLSVTQAGAGITINSVTRTSGATANPIVISVALDTSDPDLQANTDGVNFVPIELIYTRVGGGVGCTNCIRDNVDEELNTIATGDTNSTNTEVDFMKPVVLSAFENLSTTRNLDLNTFQITYSERMSVSLDNDGGVDISVGGTPVGISTATAGAMTTARTMAGMGTWASTNGGDMANHAAGDNEVVASNNDLLILINEVDTGYFASGTVPPTTPIFTPTYAPNTVFDAAGNGVSTNPVTMYVNVAWDVTPPTVTNTYSCYSTANGTINRMQINFSENIDDNNVAAGVFEADNDATNNSVGEETPVSFNTNTAGCDGNSADSDDNDDKLRIDLTTGSTGTDLAYVHYAAAGGHFVRDTFGNLLANGSALGTENDRAAPIVMSTTPTNNSTIVYTTSIVLNFSEAMDATAGHFTYTFPGEPTLTQTWTSANSVLTLSGGKVHGYKPFTVTAGPDAASQAFGTFLATSSTSFYLTVLGGGTDNGSTTVAPTYSLTLTSPTADSSFSAGSSIPVTWTSTETNSTAMNYVNLAYSTDNGSTFTTIANAVANNGSYTWTAPNLDSSTVTIKIEGTDLVTALANSTSAAFTVSTSATAGSTDASSDTTTSNTTLPAGSFVKGSSDSAVYYITTDGHRLPFINEQVFATYASDFNNVVSLNTNDLSSYPLGAPVAPKPGTVLVKIQSMPDTYAVTGTPEQPVLRLISSESLATSLYGSNWADYVIDLPPTMWPHLSFGSTIESASDLTVDPAALLRRVDLVVTSIL